MPIRLSSFKPTSILPPIKASPPRESVRAPVVAADRFEGPSSSASTTPVADKYIAQLSGLSSLVSQGLLSGPELEKRLAALPIIPADEIARMWSTPEGQAERMKLDSALYSLADLAPDARFPPDTQTGHVWTLLESSMLVQVEEAQFAHDLPSERAAAARFLAKFPDSPVAPWLQEVAAGAA